MSFRRWSDYDKNLLTVIVLFLLVTLPFLHWSSFIINPDGIEYVAIARHYLAGHFGAAVNGIWSPLLSWFLVIPLALHINPLLFFRALMVVLSIAILIAASFLMRALSKKPSATRQTNLAHTLSLVALAAFCVYATLLTPVTPDLFSVFLAICFVLAINNHFSGGGWLGALLIGLLAGLGFYGKNYFLYFSLASYVIYYIAVWLYKKDNRKSLSIHLAISIAATVVVVGPWIGLMSIKYHHFTINPIGGYSMSHVGPHYPGAPVMTLGLLKPPYPDSTTAREDPTLFKYVKWSPTESKSAFKYYLANIIPTNIKMAIKIMWPILIMLLVAILLIIRDRNSVRMLKSHYLWLLLVASAIYIGGYCLDHLDGGFRYVWPAYVLLGILLFRLVLLLKKTASVYALVILTLVIGLYPFFEGNSLSSTINSARHDKQVKLNSTEVQDFTNIPKHSKIASNDPYSAANLCYYLSLSCYGLPHNQNVENQLAKDDIQYFINFTHSKPIPVSGKIIFTTNDLTILKL